MEKETKITAPEGCEIEKVELIDGVAVVTFREKERKLPKSFEEFCRNYDIKVGECRIMSDGLIAKNTCRIDRNIVFDPNVLPDLATAEAVLALCQLIQLRDCYNGDWVPDWTDNKSKFTISFVEAEIQLDELLRCCTPLFFKSEVLRDEFLRNFRPLIEKIKPLYGIKLDSQQ